jgi:hypothetical protein
MRMSRPYWNPPAQRRSNQALRAWDKATFQARAERFRLLMAEFGPPADMLLVGGIPAMFAINELKSSFIAGNFLATVLVAQSFAEHSLGAGFSMSGDDRLAQAGFAKLIDASVKRGWLDSDTAAQLHELRGIRNPYVHPTRGTRSYMERLRKKAFPDPERLAGEDAEFAVRTIVNWLRRESSGWAPRNSGARWPAGAPAAV